MSTPDHRRWEDDLAAWMLGSLDDDEAERFEQHLAGCERCRADLDRLRPAVDAVLERREAPERTEAEALRRDTARQVRSALGGLPNEQSRVIELAYFGGFTHSEIAKMLGMPVGTVKGRMRLGLEKMRARFTEFAEGVE